LTARAEPARSGPAPAGVLRRAWRGLSSAVTLLTVVPLPRADAASLSESAPWFPLVGAAVGALAGAVRVAAEHGLGRTTATLLSILALVVVTGALHQDGLADTADGLGARGGRERRLAVMRDSSTGVFGVLALIGWALLLASALARMTSPQALVALIAACACARWAALIHAVATPPARADGLGVAFSAGTAGTAMGSVLAAAVALIAGGPVRGALAVGSAALVAAAISAYARRALGGRTGDTLGTAVALAELLAVIALSATH
jgi:adenosylcobinamide-GDP ribazoletransferase